MRGVHGEAEDEQGEDGADELWRHVPARLIGRRASSLRSPSSRLDGGVAHLGAIVGTMSRRCLSLRRPAPFPSPRCSSSRWSPPAAATAPARALPTSRPPRPNRKPRTRSRSPRPKALTAETVDADGRRSGHQHQAQGAQGHRPAPTALKAETLIAGNGAEIKSGQQATVNYVGVLFKDGKEFDTSWGKGKQPFQFALGSGQVIPGWDQGVLGMKVGERRRLTIPADLAYGAQGSPPKIGPNEPLIFDMDLKKIG